MTKDLTFDVNQHDILCRNPECRSIIARTGSLKFIDKSYFEKTLGIKDATEESAERLRQRVCSFTKYNQISYFQYNLPEIQAKFQINQDESVPKDCAFDGYWLASSPFDFDNIGFSKPLEDIAPNSLKRNTYAGMRFLCCAECEIAPLGFQDVNNQNSESLESSFERKFSDQNLIFLDASRVSYK